MLEYQAGRAHEADFVICDQAIENGLHHRRDVPFQEDAIHLTRGNPGHVMAILSNLVISLLRWYGHANLAHARRFYEAHLSVAVGLVTATPA